MNVREMGGIQTIQYPRRKRCSKVAMERGHGACFDPPFEARPHNELIALPKLFQEARDFTEIVSEVRIPHQHVLTTDERHGVNISAAESTARRFQDVGSCG